MGLVVREEANGRMIDVMKVAQITMLAARVYQQTYLDQKEACKNQQ